MHANDENRHRLVVADLRARRELFEIERATLSREMTSHSASPELKKKALKRRLELDFQCREITNRLKSLCALTASDIYL